MVTTKEFSTSGQEPAPGLKTYKVVVAVITSPADSALPATVRGIEIVAVAPNGGGNALSAGDVITATTHLIRLQVPEQVLAPMWRTPSW